jgi:nudix-type nucleoside diphosphatase (YffH/AdpP family)
MPASLALPATGHLREGETPFRHAVWAERLGGLDLAHRAPAMTTVFLYGTLMHPPHLETLLGRAVPVRPAVLDGWSRGRDGANPWPLMTPEPGARTQGLVFDATPEDLERLTRYEGAHGYAPRRVATLDGAAVAFVPNGGGAPSGPWSLEAWAEAWGALAVEVAREAREDAAAPIASVRRRAAARLHARSAGTERAADLEVTERRRPYSGFYAFEEVELRHRRFDGGWSPVIERGVLVSFDAVIVLPYDPVRDRVLLIEQFRVGRLVRGEPDPWSVEPVAGLLDPGESPEACARREGLEEAGVEMGTLHRASAGYTSPGASTGYHHHFVGLCDLPDGAAGLGGLDEEDEDIRGHLMPADELIAGVSSGTVDNAPLILLALWLALNRERLRAGG